MLEHVAIWTRNLEGMKDFYCSYFDGKAGAKYQSKSEFHANFESYFTGAELSLPSAASPPPDSGV